MTVIFVWILCCCFLITGICTTESVGFKLDQETGKYTKSNIFLPVLPDRPFVSVWNIDTGACQRNYNVSIDLTYFDIVVNPNQTRNGDKMVIFYAANLGCYPHFDDSGKPIYGGIPQGSNITAHYDKCVKDIEAFIPNKNFEGLAVIDWEAWRPVWEYNGWGNLMVYQTASIAKVQKEHPSWPSVNVTAQAKIEFEKAAKSYMLGTLELGKLVRPKAKWGYYLYPDCYNYDKTGHDLTCHKEVIERNNKQQWVFDASTALYPSTYLGSWFKNQPSAAEYTANRVNEAKRVDFNRPFNISVPIYVYNNLVYRLTRDFLLLEDIEHSSGVAALLGASGVVLWGDYMQNSKNICIELSNYVTSTLGPYMKFLSDGAQECSIEKCNGHGRCVVYSSDMYQDSSIPMLMKMFLHYIVPDASRYEVYCQCYVGFKGADCGLLHSIF